MDLFDLSISNSPASLMLIIPDRPDHSLRQQDAPPPQGTASEPSTLTTRHRPTAHRDERTGAPASQRSASQSRHDWKRRHQAAARRDGPGTRLSRNRGTARKDAYQRLPPARVSSRSALDARTQTRRCPPGGGGLEAGCRTPLPVWSAWRTDIDREPGFPDHPRLPPCEDYRERPGRDVWCRTALFSAVLLPTLRPDPEERTFSLTWPPTLRIRRWFGTIVLYGIDNGSAPAGSKPVQGRARP